MSKKQMPVTKCFISFNTERTEELCGLIPKAIREHRGGEAAKSLFVRDGEKQTARLEDPGGP